MTEVVIELSNVLVCCDVRLVVKVDEEGNFLDVIEIDEIDPTYDAEGELGFTADRIIQRELDKTREKKS